MKNDGIGKEKPTKPTQAQIEAAAKVLARSDPEAYLPAYYPIAEAALTAAAEVSERDPYADWIEARKHEVELTKLATIERCAQVVGDLIEKYRVGEGCPCNALSEAITSIRALKDKP